MLQMPTLAEEAVGASEVGIVHSVVTDSSWQTGHCDAVMVDNTTDAPVIWQLTITLEATIANAWNCTRSGDTGEVVFTGADWNREIAAGASTVFGYCVER